LRILHAVEDEDERRAAALGRNLEDLVELGVVVFADDGDDPLVHAAVGQLVEPGARTRHRLNVGAAGEIEDLFQRRAGFALGEEERLHPAGA
jgi:hypothetical protein